MAKNNLPKKKFIKVKWQDHHSDSAWKNEKELKEWATKPFICVTKGWLVFEDKNVLVLSASFDGEDSYGENMCILKVNIVT